MMHRNDLLKSLLVRHRELRCPQDTDRRGKPIGPGPKRRRLSAEAFAKHLGVSKPYYLDIENSRRQATVDELEEIAALLTMTWRARAALFRRALGCEPLAASPLRPGASAPAALQQALREPQPTCITDLAYTIHSHNDQFAALLPHAAISAAEVPRPNLMRTMLLSSQPRDQTPNTEGWAEELTAELIESVAMHPDHPELHELHAEVAADDRMRPIYEKAGEYTYPDRDCKVVLSHTIAELQVRHLILVDR